MTDARSKGNPAMQRRRITAALVAGLACVPPAASAGFSTIHTFNCITEGCAPIGGLTRHGTHFLWGVTHSGPYKVTADGTVTPLHLLNNGTDGTIPVVAPTWLGGPSPGGWFYGVNSSAGNSPGAGTIYRVKPNMSFQVTYDFTGGADGEYPFGKLLAGSIGGAPMLYGTTFDGGSGFGGNGFGTIFRFDPASNSIASAYPFAGGTDGGFPGEGLAAYNNMLYGTTRAGGTFDQGTLFMIDQSLSNKTILYSFGTNSSTDGTSPSSRLLVRGGKLYGTTVFGGTKGVGIVYSFDTVLMTEAVVWNFQDTDPNDGRYPFGDLIKIGNGNALYGTTENGGSVGNGTVYKLVLTPVPSITVLHAFGTQNGDGTNPTSGVTYAPAPLNLLYGTTALSPGTIFTQTP
jgi:uncharacterized repeat protein (TIGR03803 family)